MNDQEIEDRINRLEVALKGAEIELRIARVFIFVIFRYLGFFKNGLSVLDEFLISHKKNMGAEDIKILEDRVEIWKKPMSD